MQKLLEEMRVLLLGLLEEYSAVNFQDLLNKLVW